MVEAKAVQLEVQLDTNKIRSGVTETKNLLEGIKSAAEKIAKTFFEVLNPRLDGLHSMQMSFDNISSSMDVVVEKMTELVSLSTPQEDSIFSSMISGVDGFNAAADGITNLDGISEAIRKGKKTAQENGEDFNILKALIPESYDLAGELRERLSKGVADASSGIDISAVTSSIGEYVDAVESAKPEVGTFAALFPNLSVAVSDAGQKMRDFGSAIGTAFSNFGTTIAQLASSTGTWIANTAAKVGNTAAQWAQIAATTAWNAICAVGTAVTTAFGAAMSFLTSPIGLVVLAIVALIAIIVLLIANWDTVKAAVLTAWEAIKGALATAAEWFDTNVIQPVVGGFKTAFEWVSTKLQAGFAFVQSIFAGISSFMQGVFAKDWTEQFGAFGNVLNAFFANVENIWNSVKAIFNGIVGFIKNVFAGDWGAAWDSVVGVFKGIWDFLVSIVKAPINAIIGLINGLVEGVVDGINMVIGALNNISFDIPDWVPLIGGQTFGFNLTPLVAPKIPLLAQGAVLPANKPFLAMVGDQRHGTNVEAPLATIQEAVAMVMEDQFAGMMAGFEASVGVQKQILQAVLGIEIGDSTIGQAAARYNRKMAIIKGGM